MVPLAKKDKNKELNKKQKSNKKESLLATKESFCAATAVFAFLALLILFSRSFIFGDVGFAVFSFFTGLFGYFAYLLVIGVFYVCVTGLLGKRLVRNRLLGFGVAMTIISLMLIVHTATTFSWENENYLYRCFTAGEGESVFSITAMGLLGGLIVYGVSLLLSKIGALLFFSALTAFFLYLSMAFAKRKVEDKADTFEDAEDMPEDLQPDVMPMQAQQPYGYNAPPMETYDGARAMDVQSPYPSGITYGNGRNGYPSMPVVSQRPGVLLSEEDAPSNASGAYSPFGTPQETVKEEEKPMDGRAFLFGGSPADHFRRNLIFDPSAKANNRPDFDPDTVESISAYTPSYSEAYEDSINNSDGAQPKKVVEDAPYYGFGVQNTNREETVPTPVAQEPVQYPTLEEDNSLVSPFETDRGDSTSVSVDRETPVSSDRDATYRRHDYMDLFSPANPNVFGRDSGIEHTGEENFTLREERIMDEPSTVREEPVIRGFAEETPQENAFERFTERSSERTERDGLHLLDEDDEKEESPYSLRSDFSGSENRGRDTADDLLDTRSSRDTVSGRGGENDVLSDRSVVSDRAPIAPKPAPKEVEQPKPEPPKPPRVIRPYVRVRLDDLDCRDIEPTVNQEEVEEIKSNIISTLEDFKIMGASIASVTFGPMVTRYNVTIPRNISPKKVVALDQSIAISLHSSGVNVYPNYEDGVVSIEVPNKERQIVRTGSMLTGDTFVNAKPSSLMFTMGKDVANRKVYGDISKMIHMLVAGSSGSGKSVFLTSLLISLIYKYSPEELRLIIVDPKKEFVLYNNLPHMLIGETITDIPRTIQSLNWAIGEMNRRYGLFEQMSRAGTYVVNIDQYNAQLEKNKRLPKIVIVLDEVGDLMLYAKKEIEDRIQNLTQKARAAGIHLIVATQRPSTDVITGVIKSNLPTRVAFYVATDVDSRVILDQTGAQKLLGKGDCLYTMPGINTPQRVQSAFISPEETQKVIDFIKNNNEAYYDEEIASFINNSSASEGEVSGNADGNETIDPICIEALKYVIQTGSASISMIQRKCSAGYNRAGKIIDWMEEKGYVSAFDGAKARKVLITQEDFERLYGDW